jgi:hypothetical protein
MIQWPQKTHRVTQLPASHPDLHQLGAQEKPEGPLADLMFACCDQSSLYFPFLLINWLCVPASTISPFFKTIIQSALKIVDKR